MNNLLITLHDYYVLFFLSFKTRIHIWLQIHNITTCSLAWTDSSKITELHWKDGDKKCNLIFWPLAKDHRTFTAEPLVHTKTSNLYAPLHGWTCWKYTCFKSKERTTEAPSFKLIYWITYRCLILCWFTLQFAGH